ncbi:MAG TPA: type IVB secretion system protein IcmJDotN [Gammaproteobacteria bacterium]|nr:type IVB secretion system protein IcmJDotN [Gammaproteobacteria bacterium]
MMPLKLSATPGSWALFSARRSDKAFERFRQKILERDQNTCQYCGFQANEFQEIVNLDGDYRNNKMDNMVIACCFCTQCHFLEAVGRNQYGGGTLIYLPDMTQEELDGLCHVLFCAIANATAYRDDAQAIYRNLKLRSQELEQHLGEGMSNPALLGQMMIDAQLDNRKSIEATVLDKIRLLPSRSRFAEQIDAWAKAALEELAETQEK